MQFQRSAKFNLKGIGHARRVGQSKTNRPTTFDVGVSFRVVQLLR